MADSKTDSKPAAETGPTVKAGTTRGPLPIVGARASRGQLAAGVPVVTVGLVVPLDRQTARVVGIPDEPDDLLEALVDLAETEAPYTTGEGVMLYGRLSPADAITVGAELIRAGLDHAERETGE